MKKGRLMKRDFLETYNSIRKAAIKPSKVIVPKKGAYSRKWDWRKDE